MYTQQLMLLGLPKNEAQIYEALVLFGELSVAQISKQTNIHRRNVYDCLSRMQEKGFVSIIVDSKENHYKAVDPKKLNEIVAEKQNTLNQILPGLQKLWTENPHNEEVYIMKGIEGYKNYMNEILMSNSDLYAVGAGGLWADPKVKAFIEKFIKKFHKKRLKAYVLYDQSIKEQKREILNRFGSTYKFLDKKYNSGATMDIFGDFVVITTKGEFGQIKNSIITIIKNKIISDAFKHWFKVMWDSTPEN